MKGNIWQVALVAVLLALLLPAANVAFTANTDVPRESENVTIQYQPQRVNPNQTAIRFLDNETVSNASTGAQFVEDADYRWFPDNGSIRFNTTQPDVTAGNNATVNYSYRAGSEATRTGYEVLSAFGGFAGLLLLLVCVGALLNYTFGGGGF